MNYIFNTEIYLIYSSAKQKQDYWSVKRQALTLTDVTCMHMLLYKYVYTDVVPAGAISFNSTCLFIY